jgi:hypothetical protein
MLYRLFTEYWRGEPSAETVWQHNAYLEATLIRTRLLIAFFEGSDKANKDDVFAGDYGFPARQFPFSDDLCKRINKRIAHLTYARTEVREDERPWNFRLILPAILQRCHEFLVHLLNSGQPMSEWPGNNAVKSLVDQIATTTTH